jgi:hypothetical protein
LKNNSHVSIQNSGLKTTKMSEVLNFIPVSQVKRTQISAPKGLTDSKSKTYAYKRMYLKFLQSIADAEGHIIRSIATEPNFELKPAECSFVENKDKAGVPTGTYSLAVTVEDLEDLAGLEEIYYGILNCVYQWRQQFGRPNMDPTRPDDTIAPLISYDTDKNTGQRVEGARPTLWLRLEGNEPPPKFITFKPKYNEQGEIIPDEWDEVENTWQSLIGSKITASVIFQVRDIFKAAATSAQKFVRSCVVFDRSGTSEIKHDKSTTVRNMIREQLKSNPEAMKALAEEMSRLQVAATPAGHGTSVLKSDNARNNNANATGQVSASANIPQSGMVLFGSNNQQGQPQQQQMMGQPQQQQPAATPQMPMYQQFAQQPQQMMDQQMQMQTPQLQQYPVGVPLPGNVGMNVHPSMSVPSTPAPVNLNFGQQQPTGQFNGIGYGQPTGQFQYDPNMGTQPGF